MQWRENQLSPLAIGKYILLCFSLVVLACAAKNYLAFWLQGTAYCEYLCPSLFGRKTLPLPQFLETFFALQKGITETAQEYLELWWGDPHHFFATLAVAPLVEELIYRGPLLLLRRRFAAALPFWVPAVALALLFTLSHDRNGLLLLPIFTLGLSSAWLIARTGRFWPSLAFHMLYNAYSLSLGLYQTLFWSD